MRRCSAVRPRAAIAGMTWQMSRSWARYRNGRYSRPHRLLRRRVVEYQVAAKECPACGEVSVGLAPARVTGRVQYGPLVHARAALAVCAPYLPVARAARRAPSSSPRGGGVLSVQDWGASGYARCTSAPAAAHRERRTGSFGAADRANGAFRAEWPVSTGPMRLPWSRRGRNPADSLSGLSQSGYMPGRRRCDAPRRQGRVQPDR